MEHYAPSPRIQRFLYPEVGPENFGLVIVVGIAVVAVQGWWRNRAAVMRLIAIGSRPESLLAIVVVSVRAP